MLRDLTAVEPKACGTCVRNGLSGSLLVVRIAFMSRTNPSSDWVGRARTNVLAWWLPYGAIVAGLFVAVPARTAIWIIALIWMGVACLLNSRRCGRTHCRFTGPYYLAMTIPVLAVGVGVVSADLYGWFALAVFIAAGSKVIWWATERAWGKFS